MPIGARVRKCQYFICRQKYKFSDRDVLKSNLIKNNNTFGDIFFHRKYLKAINSDKTVSI